MAFFLLSPTPVNVPQTWQNYGFRERDTNIDLILRRPRFWNEYARDLLGLRLLQGLRFWPKLKPSLMTGPY